MGLPIELQDENVKDKFKNEKITIYFNFDYLSDIYRKNVYTLVDYVKRKNIETKNKFNLILKSINGIYFPLEKAYLNYLISGVDNIREIDTFLGNEDFKKLINEVDIYVSLHRSEGFGLGLAEALSDAAAVLAGLSARRLKQTVRDHRPPQLPHLPQKRRRRHRSGRSDCLVGRACLRSLRQVA